MLYNHGSSNQSPLCHLPSQHGIQHCCVDSNTLTPSPPFPLHSCHSSPPLHRRPIPPSSRLHRNGCLHSPLTLGQLMLLLSLGQRLAVLRQLAPVLLLAQALPVPLLRASLTRMTLPTVVQVNQIRLPVILLPVILLPLWRVLLLLPFLLLPPLHLLPLPRASGTE